MWRLWDYVWTPHCGPLSMWRDAGTETREPRQRRVWPVCTQQHRVCFLLPSSSKQKLENMLRNGLSRGSVVNMTESVQNQVYIAHTHIFREINTRTEEFKNGVAQHASSPVLGHRSQRAHTVRTGRTSVVDKDHVDTNSASFAGFKRSIAVLIPKLLRS